MEDRSQLQRHAMILGTYMGLFWIFKFTFFPLGLSSSLSMMVFWGLTLAVPFMGYRYVRLYRDRVLTGQIGLLHALTFSMFMYMYASLLTAVAHFVYFSYIDQGHLLASYRRLLEEFAAQGEQGRMMADQFTPLVEAIGTLKPIETVMELLSNNLFIGLVISLPTALLLRRRQSQTS